MGRPRKSPDELRDGYYQFRLTSQERAELERRANAFGLPLSDYIRRQTLGRPLPTRRAGEANRAKLATALLRIGVNLNQIAKHMNAGRSAPYHLPDLINEIRGHVTRLTFDESGRNRSR
ncbi:plasmid mobilization protein [Jiella marina]|uniref:plasmid mobilization protein n=1 Tax=Jiella sp. LLJ827 TaxID=2917712 RepID=UPI0021011614|nr:plasmid mobilization relaxosome protein MobC [Jiella sp. LLJ827]MCQ0990602.1 plasmid mobilization relaxosome protein MobC [Jiella sp. LLJ827]